MKVTRRLLLDLLNIARIDLRNHNLGGAHLMLREYRRLYATVPSTTKRAWRGLITAAAGSPDTR